MSSRLIVLAALAVASLTGCTPSEVCKHAETVLCGCESGIDSLQEQAAKGCDMLKKGNLILPFLPPEQRADFETQCASLTTPEMEQACTGAFDPSTMTDLGDATSTDEAAQTATEEAISTDPSTDPGLTTDPSTATE